MPIWDAHRPVRHLPYNEQGNDYIIGDLHGCYDQLFTLLNHVKFNDSVDRVISVGDLIDRGPESLKCAELVYQPWFYSVQGNHEQLMIESMQQITPSWVWLDNGGTWYYNHSETVLRDVAKSLSTLPYVIVVGDGEQRYNVVHAEFTRATTVQNVVVTDDVIDDFAFVNTNELTWGRSLIKGYGSGDHDVHQMSITFVGHTPTVEPIRLMQQVYLDGGAVFGVRRNAFSDGNNLNAFCWKEQAIYRLNVRTNDVSKYELSEITVAT